MYRKPRKQVVALVITSFFAVSLQLAYGQRPKLPEPDFADVSYGAHERNRFDFWQAVSERPTPLVIYYHGGGFQGGDKRSLNRQLLELLLRNGISVAAVNYRLTDVGPYPMQMLDCARALQTIRAERAKYNIDPTRVGATGGSAGAGISMWLAFHKDLAEPNSSDPVARQSTRLTCAVVQGAQSTYDPRVISKLFNTERVHEALIPFFLMENEEDVNDPEKIKLFEDSSPVHHLTADDPPVRLCYNQSNEPMPPNSTGKQHIHHPKLGFYLKEKMDKLGIECELMLREDYKANPDADLIEDHAKFFIDKLLGT